VCASCRRTSGRARARRRILEARGRSFYRIRGPLCEKLLLNEFVYQEGERPLLATVKEMSEQTAVLETVRDYTHAKNNVWGITARNREQNFALNLLMNPDIDFVSLLGQAGTGKTLLALAAGLMQTLETKQYSEIIITRVTVPVGEDIGFLPGTEEEKMTPWMGALEDNLEILDKTDEEAGEWAARRRATSSGPGSRSSRSTSCAAAPSSANTSSSTRRRT